MKITTFVSVITNLLFFSCSSLTTKPVVQRDIDNLSTDQSTKKSESQVVPPTLPPSSQDSDCSPVLDGDLSYGLRDQKITQKKRCEGLVSDKKTNNIIELVSFSTRKLDSYEDDVNIEVPQVLSISGKTPYELRIESWGNNYHYLLDNFSLKSNGEFSWKSEILTKKSILPKSLRGLATYNINSKLLHIPVIVGEKGDEYEFVFRSKSQVKFDVFEIRSVAPSKVVYRHPSQDFRDVREGETTIPWGAKNQPSGRYKLYYHAWIRIQGQAMYEINGDIEFEHNPNWLK
jgi:hypothetical protein